MIAVNIDKKTQKLKRLSDIQEPKVANLNKSKAEKMKKSVSFSDDVHIHEIPAIADLTLEQVSNTWFDRFDYWKIKSDHSKLVKKLEAGKGVDANEDCHVCLRKRTDRFIRISQQRRRDALNAVFDEQFEQKQEGVNDDIVIAKIYSKVALQSRIDAENFGRCMQREVQRSKLSKKRASLVRFTSWVVRGSPRSSGR